jgi:capsular exopolysaccharide synthesis family protein
MLAQEQGKKVLLIDADLRAAGSGDVIGVGRGRHGLSELLQGSATLDQCIVDCTDANLSFLPAGPMVDKPTELLGTPQFEQCLREVQRMYDWIVIDSPPLLALADAKVIAALCDTSILVVKSRGTPKTCAKEAIKRIGKERVCGIVLNRIQRSMSSPYYAYYNHYPTQKQQAEK